MFNYIMSDKKCESVAYKTEILLVDYWLSGKAGRKNIWLGVMAFMEWTVPRWYHKKSVVLHDVVFQ